MYRQNFQFCPANSLSMVWDFRARSVHTSLVRRKSARKIWVYFQTRPPIYTNSRHQKIPLFGPNPTALTVDQQSTHTPPPPTDSHTVAGDICLESAAINLLHKWFPALVQLSVAGFSNGTFNWCAKQNRRKVQRNAPPPVKNWQPVCCYPMIGFSHRRCSKLHFRPVGHCQSDFVAENDNVRRVGVMVQWVFSRSLVPSGYPCLGNDAIPKNTLKKFLKHFWSPGRGKQN